MKKLTLSLIVIIMLFVCASTVYAPTAEDAYRITEERLEVPCASPKYEVHRDEYTGVQIGARWANGCKADTTPRMVCPDGTSPLFDVLGPITEGMTLSNGARVTDVKGNWIVSYQDNTLLVSGGRKLTITFPSDTYVIGMLVYDHDPKAGQEGWTLDGNPVTVTPRRSWGALYSVESFEGTLVFDNGDDSAHFNICL